MRHPKLKPLRNSCLYSLSEPLLAYPDFENEKLILTTGFAIGACLSQVQDNLERPTAHASRVPRPVEQRYSTTKRGALALWEYVRKFRHYLQPKAFVVRTDHQPLKALPFMDVTAGKLAKICLDLPEFTSSVKYKPGEEMFVDALSLLVGQVPEGKGLSSMVNLICFRYFTRIKFG